MLQSAVSQWSGFRTDGICVYWPMQDAVQSSGKLSTAAKYRCHESNPELSAFAP